MMHDLDTLTSIHVFGQVVESGSFVAAAERLGISALRVSNTVGQIEQRLGVRLVLQNGGALSLTRPGQRYFEHCRMILADLEATALELGPPDTTTREGLRVTAPSWAAGKPLADLLARFRRLHPQIVVDISFEDRTVDLLEEGYDLAMRVATSAESLPCHLIACPLRPLTFHLAASREYLKLRGAPSSPEDLARHDFVAVGKLDTLPLIGARGKIELPVRAVVRYPSMAGVAHAVAAGIGMAALPAFVLEDPVFKDVLVPILPEHPSRQATWYLVYAGRQYVPLKIRSFVDFMAESMAEPGAAALRR